MSPYSFEVRPSGFRRDEPHYRVVVERSAFSLRATVVPDYLAVAIVAAIVAGARNNPVRENLLRTSLTLAGWLPDIVLTQEGFRLQATNRESGGLSDTELASTGVTAAVLLSEFVLDQLIVTRSYGEMRPAVERPIGEAGESELWLYDPSERDRATRVHRALENWLILKLREVAVEPFDPAGEPFFDLAWKSTGTLVVCEVKSTSNNEDHQIRLALGQVLHYRELLEKAGATPVLPTILIEGQPHDHLWPRICERAGVILFWPEAWQVVAPSLVAVERFSDAWNPDLF